MNVILLLDPALHVDHVQRALRDRSDSWLRSIDPGLHVDHVQRALRDRSDSWLRSIDPALHVDHVQRALRDRSRFWYVSLSSSGSDVCGVKSSMRIEAPRTSGERSK